MLREAARVAKVLAYNFFMIYILKRLVDISLFFYKKIKKYLFACQ
jgi:hypothetical protein